MENEKITILNTAKVGGLIIMAALIINSIIFFIGDAIDAFNVKLDTIQGERDFAVQFVIMFTVTFLIFGLIGFLVLTKGLNQSIERVRIIAIILVLASLAMPLGIAGASAKFVGILFAIHISTGLIAIPGLTTSYLWNKV